MKEYLLTRLREASTWRGLVMLITALGITLSPEQVAAIIAAGTAVVGVIGVFLPDGKQA